MNKKTSLLLIAVIIVVGALVWFFVLNKSATNTPTTGVDSTGAPIDSQSGLGGQVFNQVNQNSVGGNIPQTNPFKSGTGVNPYADAYKNPFAQ